MESREAGHQNNKESRESMEGRESWKSSASRESREVGKEGMQGNREAARKEERVRDFIVYPLKLTEFLKKICRRKFSPAQSGGKVEFNPFQVSEWSEGAS